MKVFVCTLLIALCAMTAMAADVTGKWSGSFVPEGGDPGQAFVILKQTGTTLSGSAGPDENQQWPLTGTIDGNKITAEVKSPEGMVFKVEMMLEGDHLKGSAVGNMNGETMRAKLDLTKAKS